MIRKISAIVSGWLTEEGIVSNSDQELFAYAVYSLLFGLSPFLIVTLLGIAFGMLYEGLLLILPFMLIRKFSGGYHLKSPVICIISSAALIAISLWMVKSITTTGNTMLLTYFTVLSVTSIWLCSPIDSEARKLSEKEKKQFGTVARVLSAVILLFYLLLLRGGSIRSAVPVGMGILIAASLQIPNLIGLCFRRKSRVKH